MFKKVFIALGALGLALGLASCKGEEEKPYTLPDDTYEMGLGEDIVDALLNTAMEGVSTGARAVVGSLFDWTGQKIGAALGYKNMDELAYRDEVIDRLKKQEHAILNLEKKLDILSETEADKFYRNRYTKFKDHYKNIKDDVLSIYSQYNDLETAIEEKSISDEKIIENYNSIYQSIQGTEVNFARLEPAINKMASFFISDDDEISALSEHSIISIVEHYARANSPYNENIHKSISDMMAEPLSLFYHGTFLLDLNYSHTLKLANIDKIYVSSEGEVYAYVLNGTYYLHSSASSKADNVKAYQDEFTKALKAEKKKLEDDKAKGDTTAKPEDINLDLKLQDIEPKLIGNVSAAAKYASYHIGIITKNYNTVKKGLADVLDKYKVGKKDDTVKHITYGDNTYTHKLQVKSVVFADLIDSGEGEDTVLDYSKWGNIKDSEFKALCAAWLEAASVVDDKSVTWLTFRELLEKNGFQFPTNNKANYLILGVKMGKKGGYAQNIHNGAEIALQCVRLDRTVKDFLEKKTYDVVRYASATITGSCKTDYEMFEYTDSGNVNKSGDNLNYKNWNDSNLKVFYTIYGLTNSPQTGKKKGIDMTF